MNEKRPMTIGELKSTLKRKPGAASILFDFAHFRPDGCHSYRGYYDRPAIGYGHNDAVVSDVVSLLERLTREEFYGYKGGTYTYTDDQPLYVSNHNEAGGTMIVDVFEDGPFIRLETAFFDN